MRFGILCNGFDFQRWQAESISELISHGHVPVVLIKNSDRNRPSGFFTRWRRKNWKTLLFSITENRIFKPGARETTNMQRELQGVLVISCDVKKEKYYSIFSDSDLDRIRELNLDFILRFAFQILKGGILTVAKHGVWSFHHGDELKFRGGPAGFWEIFHNENVNGAILQQLTDRLDGGIILKKGYLKTQLHSWKQNLEQLYSVTAAWPALVAAEITLHEKSGKILPFRVSEGTGKLYRVPGNSDMVKFLFRLSWNRLKFIFQKYFLTEKWNIGIISQPLQEVVMGNSKVSDNQITWLPELPGQEYLADPFAIVSEGSLMVFAEHFHYDTMKGDIRRINQGKQPRVIQFPGKEAVHLSYPSVVKSGDEYYCLPESWQAGEVAIFRFNSDFSGFSDKKVILGGVEAVDPTLYFHAHRWWLFFTYKKYSNSHLFLWFSDNLDGPYCPHRLNPVKTDVRSARPAGNLFMHDGSLYRPGQDCSLTYGGRIAINRVVEISPDTFVEETTRFLSPDPKSRYNEALHTISGADNFTLIDGKYLSVSWKYGFQQIKKRLMKDKSYGWSK
jgi:hypothetical protein